MKLLTKKIESAFEKQGDTSHLQAKDIKVIMKIFNPMGSQTWWMYERLDEDIFMAFVTLGDAWMAELGTVSLAELESIELPLGLRLERDMYFNTDTTLQSVIDEVKGQR